MNAVIYARFSSHAQQEQSIEGQLRDCYEYAKNNDIKIVGEYIDRALSAKTDNRQSFQRMIKDSEKGLFSQVLVWKLDRFSRNRYDSATYKAKLKKNGVRVISIKENITDTPEGILIESLLEGMAEYYSADLAEKVNRGMRETALKGRFNGGHPPLGYKINDGRYEIDEIHAPIIKQIFQMYADGTSKTEIVEFLNKRNIKTSYGNKFSMNSFNTILKNRRYLGIYIYKDIEIPEAIPQIIDNDLFERVQKMIKKNKRQGAKHKAKIEYILSGKLFCGHCEAPMLGESGKGRHGAVYHYYKCYSRKHNKSCNKVSVRKEKIEDFVINTIIDNVLQDEIINKIADKIITFQKNEAKNSMTSFLEAKLKDSEKALSNIMQAIENGIFSSSTQSRLLELEEEIENLKYEIQAEKSHYAVFDKKSVVAMLSRFKDGNRNDLEYRKRLINAFVHKIFLYDDKILLFYNYSNDTDGSNEKEILNFINSNEDFSVSDFNTLGVPKTTFFL